MNRNELIEYLENFLETTPRNQTINLSYEDIILILDQLYQLEYPDSIFD